MKPFASAPWQIEHSSAKASLPAETSAPGAAATGEAATGEVATGEAATGEAATGEVAAAGGAAGAGSLSLVRPAKRKPATAMLRPRIRLDAFI
jgi:hypothetical protein